MRWETYQRLKTYFTYILLVVSTILWGIALYLLWQAMNS